MKLRTKLLLGYVLVFVLMIVIAAVTYREVGSLVDTANWVSHTHNVISKAHLVEKLLVDMETGQRGFLITGTEEFLGPYNDGVKTYEATMADLKELVSDNPAQVERLKEIETLVAKWQTVAAQPEIAERRKIVKGALDADYLQAVLAKGVGKGILDEMRETMNNMEVRFHTDGNVKGEFLTEAVAKAMVDQETGQRGFLITGEDEFLEPYREGQEELKNSITALRTLIANAHDRIATVNDLNELEKLAERWLKEVGNAEIELRRQVDAGQKTQKDIEDTLGQGKGKATLDEMRGIMYRMANRFTKSENEKARGLLVLAAKAMVDQETGQRGFIITGKDEFLEPFTNGQKAFKQATTDLRRLNSNAYDIPSMKRDIGKLQKLAGDWLKKAAIPEIAAREQMNKSASSMKEVRALIEKGTGKTVMDTLRVKLSEFIGVENELLTSRGKESEAEATRNTLTVVFGTILAIALGIIGALLVTRFIMVPVNKLNSATQAIAGGDLSQRVEIRSRDELAALGESFNRMAQANEEQDWLKTGIARLNEATQGDLGVTELASKVISELSTYLDAQVGAIYLAGNGDGTALSLLGSYAYKKRKDLSNVFKQGEGLVGQAALEKQQILVKNVPEDYIKVTSALGERIPRFICVTPFITEDRVKGVVEIGTLNEMTDRQMEYLARAMSALAITVESAQGRTNLAKSLEESQRISEELQAQQEELKTANEELEEQAQRLKASEESLKSQQEELQVTNEELEEKNDLLERQTREVEAARKDIEEKAEELALASKYKSEFLANMSHELRTSLNSLLLLAASLKENKDGNLTDDQVESVGIIYGGGNDLLNLINEILDLSKIEAGRMDLNVEELRTSDLAEGVGTPFRHVAEQKGLSLEIVVSDNAPGHISTDRQRVDQIIRNLMSNAVKFAETGSVTVTFSRPGPGVNLSRSGLSPEGALSIAVKDTGIGIEPEKQKMIFEAFQQADGELGARTKKRASIREDPNGYSN